MCFYLLKITSYKWFPWHTVESSAQRPDRTKVSASARDIRNGWWRRERWALVSARRCHSTRSNGISGLFESRASRTHRSRFWQHLLARQVSRLFRTSLLSFGETWKQKCMRTNLAHWRCEAEHQGRNQDPLTSVRCEQLYLIFGHDRRNVLHARPTTCGVWRPRNEEHILNDI